MCGPSHHCQSVSKKGVRGLLASVIAPAHGHYHPKLYTKKEDMNALLIWQLSGTWVAGINQCLNGAPGATYLSSCSIVPPLIASHAQPMEEEVQTNVKATLQSVHQWVRSTDLSKGQCCIPWSCLMNWRQKRGSIGIQRPTSSWRSVDSMRTGPRQSLSMRETWRSAFDTPTWEMMIKCIMQQRWEIAPIWKFASTHLF